MNLGMGDGSANNSTGMEAFTKNSSPVMVITTRMARSFPDAPVEWLR
jgi:hypothetical protein